MEVNVSVSGGLQKPLMVVVAAPSGAGKSTLCGMLLREFPEFVYSVSCTTRAPRGAEEHGRAYFFLTEDAFVRRMEAGDFLEHAVVHGHRYGTLRETVHAAMASGHSVMLDIDVAGAAQVRAKVAGLPETDPMRRGFLDVFFSVPSIETLHERLNRRAEDAPETIARRIRNAEAELARAGEFSHVLVNEDLDRTYAAFKAIVLAASRSGPTTSVKTKGGV